MGRRPDHVIFEFFNRGRKLEDNSNRYEHTCRRCGERFPKGRIDTLMGHVTRRCQNVDPSERDLVLGYLQSKGYKARKSRNKQPSSGGPDQAIDPNVALSSPHLQYDMSQYLQDDQHQSALDTLAEVSRRHLDYSPAQQGDHHYGQTEVQDQRQMLAEQALFAQLQEASAMMGSLDSSNQYDLTDHNATHDPNENLTFEDMPPPAPEQPQSPLVQTDADLDQQIHFVPESGATLDHNTSNPSDTNDLDESGTDHHSNTAGTSPEARDVTWLPLQTPTTPDNPSQTQSSIKPAKSTARSRFTADRRKQVGAIRKRGACMRCRMLKKPCSDGTPCDGCRVIEGARVWKGTCLRTRLADEAPLWSVGLFQARSDRAMQKLPQAGHSSADCGTIEACLAGNEGASMMFRSKRLTWQYGEDPAEPSNSGTSRQFWLLNDQDEDRDETIEGYFKSLPLSSTGTAPCIQHLMSYAAEHQFEEPDKPEAPTPKARSSYNLQSRLIDSCKELYLLTKVLTTPTSTALTLRSQISDSSDTHDQEHNNPDDWTDIPPHPDDHKTVASQITAAIEQRASKLAKTILTELERRLLQRQSASQTATFLSAVIILHCVELMTGLFHALEPDELIPTSSEASSATQHNQITPAIPPSPGIPFQTLYTQGAPFAALLTTLLRTRALPPRTTIDSNGNLVAAPAPQTSSSGSNTATTQLPSTFHLSDNSSVDGPQYPDEQTRAASQWLDPLCLNVQDLIDKRDGPLPDRSEGVEGWSMRFVAGVLLPPSMSGRE